MQFLIYNLLSILFLFILFIYRDYICLKFKLIDYPGDLSIHQNKALLFGGIFLISSLILNILILTSTSMYVGKYFSLFLIFLFFLIAFADDVKNLNPTLRLFFTISASLISIYIDPELQIKSLYFYYNNNIYLNNNLIFNYMSSTLCILLFINAFNFIDGINGLASSIGISFFLYLIIKSPLIFNFYYLFIISLIFFLYFNLKYKIFLGDAGNYLISTSIAIILLKENFYQPSLYFAEEIFLLLLVPGLDLLRLFIVRISKRSNPFKGDHNHLHHKLLKKFGNFNTIIIYLLLVNLPIYIYFFTKDFLISLIFITTTAYFILLKNTS